MFGALAEFERNLIRERTKAGLATVAMITNIDNLRCKIIALFGAAACQVYSIEENFAGT